MQKFSNIALVVLKIFKVVKSTTFLKAFDPKKPDVKRIPKKKKKIGRVHPINFFG